MILQSFDFLFSFFFSLFSLLSKEKNFLSTQTLFFLELCCLFKDDIFELVDLIFEWISLLIEGRFETLILFFHFTQLYSQCIHLISTLFHKLAFDCFETSCCHFKHLFLFLKFFIRLLKDDFILFDNLFKFFIFSIKLFIFLS